MTEEQQVSEPIIQPTFGYPADQCVSIPRSLLELLFLCLAEIRYYHTQAEDALKEATPDWLATHRELTVPSGLPVEDAENRADAVLELVQLTLGCSPSGVADFGELERLMLDNIQQGKELLHGVAPTNEERTTLIGELAKAADFKLVVDPCVNTSV